MNLPINLVLRGRRVVVIGGGNVATRKVARLVNSGAHVVVVSPVCTPALLAMDDVGKIKIVPRAYEPNDLDGALLVFAASDDQAVNFEVAEDGHRKGALVSVVNEPDAGDFSLPALVDLGGLRVAIDTQGASPALTRAFREHLEATVDPGWGRGAQILGALRVVVADRDTQEVRAAFWRALVQELPASAQRDTDEQRAWIRRGVEASKITLDLAEIDTLLKLV